MSTETDSDFQTFMQRAADDIGEIQQMMSVFRAKSCTPFQLKVFVDHCKTGIPMGLISDAMDIFCKHFDGPEFDPSKMLPSSLSDRRQLAFIALGGIGVLGNSSSSSPSQFSLEAQPAIRRSWPKIFNWIRYFCFEVTEAGLPSNKQDVSRSISVLTIVINIVYRDDSELLRKTWLKNDEELFKITLKLWWKTDKNEDTAPSLSCTAFSLVCHGAEHLSSRPSSASSDRMGIPEIILRVANDDASGIARRVLGYITNPAHQNMKNHRYIRNAILLILIISFNAPDSQLMNIFLQKKIGLLAMRELESMLLDANRRIPIHSESFRKLFISRCFTLMTQSIMSPGALHWTTVLLDNGFLRCVSNIVGSSYLANDEGRKLLNCAFAQFIPQLLVHRGFVLSTVQAVKKAIEDGSAERIESSFFGDVYKKFSRILLERAVFNAIYEQSCVDHFFEQRKCANCGSIEEFLDTRLSKCAGCSVAVYCSRDCQKEAWKEGHRRECESLKGTKQSAGEVMRYGKNTFLEHLATAEVRRHAKAIKSAINQDTLLRDKPLKDIVILVSFATYPPQIKPSCLEMEISDIPEGGRCKLKQMRSKIYTGQMLLYVVSCRGGPVCIQQAHMIPTSSLDGPAEHGGNSVILTESEASFVSVWSRTPAQSFEGKNLEFEVDEIDACLLDAHRNYQPNVRGSESLQAQTVFDYLEKKIEDRELIPYLDYLEN